MITGTHLGPYEILDKLGAGGMGEVYRARDGRLGRDVALKVLPAELSADPECLRRLETEARAMAAVVHPNVATIHAVEEHEDQVLLVLEVVEGESLLDRLRQGRLPVAKALELGRQVAAGIEAAHAQGIVHRDLKPGNVMVGPKGQVKILDFGLAKALRPTGTSAQDLSRSPTVAYDAGTQPGVVLGTAPYLSPEQARGHAVDERTDIWAFGCLLYEMLTGRRAFPGETLTDTIAAVLKQEPDWDVLPGTTPRAIRWLLRRCLDKDPDERLHAIADARLLIKGLEQLSDGSVGLQRGRPQSLLSRGIAGAAVATLAGVVIGWIVFSEARPQAVAEPPVVRFSLFADPDDPQGSFGPSWRLSPDDRFFAYQTVSRPGAPPSAIQLRSFEDGSVRELEGTDGARSMTFSPDGEQIAYFDERALKRVSLQDGTVEAVVNLDYEHRVGLAWTDKGFLAITSWIPRGLWSVDAAGGEVQGLTLRDSESLQYGTDEVPFFPDAIPGGRFLLFTSRRLPSEDHLEILSLEDGERRAVTAVGSGGAFVPPGFLAYYHQGKLFALPFDPEAGRVDGVAVAVLDGVRAGVDQSGRFSVSRSGSLAYASGVELGTLAVARPGMEPEALPLSVHRLVGPRVSPDGKRVVFASDEDSDRANLWLFDIERQTTRRITGEEGNEWWSAWAPDGRLVFQSDREDDAILDLYVMDPDRPGSTRKILDGGQCYLQPQGWSPDGLLLYQKSCVASGALDIYTLDLDTGDTGPLREDEAREKHPSISPDGRWLAFASNLSGEDQVYLTTYPEPGRLIQVSPAGGDGPIWTPSGDGLFFHSGGDLVLVPFDGEAASPLGTPEIAVRGVPGNLYIGRAYDIFPDGRILLRASSPVREVQVVLNWSRDVARKLE